MRLKPAHEVYHQVGSPASAAAVPGPGAGLTPRSAPAAARRRAGGGAGGARGAGGPRGPLPGHPGVQPGRIQGAGDPLPQVPGPPLLRRLCRSAALTMSPAGCGTSGRAACCGTARSASTTSPPSRRMGWPSCWRRSRPQKSPQRPSCCCPRLALACAPSPAAPVNAVSTARRRARTCRHCPALGHG